MVVTKSDKAWTLKSLNFPPIKAENAFQVVEDFMSDLNKTSGQQGGDHHHQGISSSSQPPLGAFQTDLRMRQLRDVIQRCRETWTEVYA